MTTREDETNEEIRKRIRNAKTVEELVSPSFELLSQDSLYGTCATDTISEIYERLREKCSFIRQKIFTSREIAFPKSSDSRELLRDLFTYIHQVSEWYVDELDSAY